MYRHRDIAQSTDENFERTNLLQRSEEKNRNLFIGTLINHSGGVCHTKITLINDTLTFIYLNVTMSLLDAKEYI